MRDPNELLRLPSAPSAGARRWLAHELAIALAERVRLRPLGAHTNLLRDLLLDAWDAGRSPTLDELLVSALQSAEPAPELPLHQRLELALRFVVAAPEFGGGAPEPAFERRACAARAAAAPG